MASNQTCNYHSCRRSRPNFEIFSDGKCIFHSNDNKIKFTLRDDSSRFIPNIVSIEQRDDINDVVKSTFCRCLKLLLEDLVKNNEKFLDLSGFIFPILDHTEWDTIWSPIFGNNTYLDFKAFPLGVNFNFACFTGYANFSYAIFSGPAKFHKTIFGGEADFAVARFESLVDFTNTRFIGEAHFNYSIFGGNTLFIGSIFKSLADYSLAQFAKYISFEYVEFSAEVTFTDATFMSGKFSKCVSPVAFIFKRTEFKETVIFEYVALMSCNVNFEDSIIHSELMFDRCFVSKDSNITFTDVHVRNNGHLRLCRFLDGTDCSIPFLLINRRPIESSSKPFVSTFALYLRDINFSDEGRLTVEDMRLGLRRRAILI